MRFEDSQSYIASQESFHPVVAGVDMISELYGEREATLLYRMRTATPAGDQRTAEHFTVADGRIASIELIFDASPGRPLLSKLHLIDG
jgi:hypothetical protein